MEGLVITHRGFEDVAAREVKELIGAKAETRDYAAVFEFRNMLDLCLLAYKSQSAIKVISLFGEFEVSKDFEESITSFRGFLSNTDVSEWIDDNSSFRVTCSRIGEHGFTSQDVMMEAGRIIKDKTNKDINLDSPDVIFHIQIIDQSGYFGVDFAGIDLSKREYRIFTHPAALKGTVAYALLRVAGYKKGDSLLDPFTKSGIIPIEAALMSANMPVNYYRKDSLAFRNLKPLENEDFDTFFRKIDSQIDEDSGFPIYGFDSSMPSISASQKNAKLAGVNKKVNFSRIEVEWLDTKFSEGEIANIASSPPEASKRTAFRFVEKLYKELFYQCKYILSDNGKMVFIVRDPELLKKSGEQYGFKASGERTVFLGKETLKVIALARN